MPWCIYHIKFNIESVFENLYLLRPAGHRRIPSLPARKHLRRFRCPLLRHTLRLLFCNNLLPLLCVPVQEVALQLEVACALINGGIELEDFFLEVKADDVLWGGRFIKVSSQDLAGPAPAGADV